MSEVILVDEQDNPRGQMEKIEAHEKGELHRCFSIFIFNALGQMLIHRRALDKYHCGGLWTNACCSHQKPNEKNEEAVHRRLLEEMGFDTELSPLLSFIYQAAFDNGLTEHEYDHVFVGEYNEYSRSPIMPNFEEVMEYKWINIQSLLEDIKVHPESYTVWFKIIVEEVLKRKDNSPDPEHIPHLGYLNLSE